MYVACHEHHITVETGRGGWNDKIVLICRAEERHKPLRGQGDHASSIRGEAMVCISTSVSAGTDAEVGRRGDLSLHSLSRTRSRAESAPPHVPHELSQVDVTLANLSAE
jgi:hypothetical protein